MNRRKDDSSEIGKKMYSEMEKELKKEKENSEGWKKCAQNEKKLKVAKDKELKMEMNKWEMEREKELKMERNKWEMEREKELKMERVKWEMEREKESKLQRGKWEDMLTRVNDVEKSLENSFKEFQNELEKLKKDIMEMLEPFNKGITSSFEDKDPDHSPARKENKNEEHNYEDSDHSFTRKEKINKEYNNNDSDYSPTRKKQRIEEHKPFISSTWTKPFISGRWTNINVESEDKMMELSTEAYFASFDQSKEGLGGASCSVCAIFIAEWLHKNKNSMPTKSNLENLIIKGSSEWRNLLRIPRINEVYPNGHFTLPIVLEQKISPLSIVEQPFGYFQSERLLENPMFIENDFEIIWEQIIDIGKIRGPKIYIVGWEDHFFILKVEDKACYIIDTLGERLSGECHQAYILKFDKKTTISQVGKEGSAREGHESCKEFLKEFWAASKLREDFTYQKAQIDFYLTSLTSPRTKRRPA